MPQQEPTPNSMIIGHVYNKEGSMLGSAKVICNDNSTVTLFDGSFRFENLPAGTYTTTVSLKGFQSQTKTVSIKEDETLTIDFYLNEAVGTSNIRGCVYDAETGRPIAYATVSIILPSANKYSATNKDGFYEFKDLTADTYELFVTVGGYDGKNATIALKEGETKTQNFYCKSKSTEEPPWG